MRRKACPKCHSKELVKAGFSPNNKQRLKCNTCRHQFVEHLTRNYPESKRKLVKTLYLEGVGFRAIGRITGISNVCALNWIRQEGISALEKGLKTPRAKIIELDELHTYIQKKTMHAGCGLLLTVTPNESLPSTLAVVIQKPPANL